MSVPAVFPSREPERLPPHNDEAEQAVLASCLLDRAVVGRIAGLLDPRDFYRERHATIYQAMLDLDERGEPVDYLTLITELDRREWLAQVGTSTYIGGLLGAVPTPIHAERYARLVAGCGLMRRLISAGGKIATIGFTNQLAPEAALAAADQLLTEVGGTIAQDDFVTMQDGLRAYLDQLGAISMADRTTLGATYRIPTTYRDLDRILGGGFARGDLVLLAGRPGMGKTSLMLEILGRSSLAYRYPSVVFSLEMSAFQLLNRMVATTSGIPVSILDEAQLSRTQERLFGIALGRLAEIDVLTCESPTISLATLRSQVRRLAARDDLGLVIVDHLQLLSAESDGRENRVAEMGRISRGLKALARDHNIVVLALSQLSRAVEQRADKIPVLSDLRESGSLEQDADVVMLLNREEVYKPDTERAGLVDLYIAKHRNGRTGKVVFTWNPETTGFRGMESYDAGT